MRRMVPSSRLHRAVATAAVLAGTALLALSVGGVRSVDAQLRSGEAARDAPVVRTLDAPALRPDRGDQEL